MFHHCTVGKLIHRVIAHFNSTKYNLTTAPCLSWNDRQPLSTLCHCHCHLNKSEWQLVWPNKSSPVLIQCVFVAMSQAPQTNTKTVSPWEDTVHSSRTTSSRIPVSISGLGLAFILISQSYIRGCTLWSIQFIACTLVFVTLFIVGVNFFI